MRIYQYISETKVDMLASQLPDSPISSIGGELELSLLGIKGKFEAKPSEPSDSTYRRTQTLADYIRKKGMSGSVGESRLFVDATMPLRSGILWDHAAGIAFFGGILDGTLVALIGSAESIVGNALGEKKQSRWLDYYTLRFLNEESERAGRIGEDSQQPDFRYARAMKTALNQVPKTWRMCEFLAIPIHRGRNILVASPIFVASAEGKAPVEDTLKSRIARFFGF